MLSGNTLAFDYTAGDANYAALYIGDVKPFPFLDSSTGEKHLSLIYIAEDFIGLDDLSANLA